MHHAYYMPALVLLLTDRLSHLLARRGMAQRIGNLIGHLHFSDDDLQKTQKGLKESGVTMPNFSNVGKELAKEINEEPEPEVETEEEREPLSEIAPPTFVTLSRSSKAFV
jgi:Ras GTPase-activating-like protein IQGAP2/3